MGMQYSNEEGEMRGQVSQNMYNEVTWDLQFCNTNKNIITG